jgi:prepilin peptidase CpaA
MAAEAQELLLGTQIGLPVLLTLAAAIDSRHRRIPNWLSLGGMAAGLMLWGWHSGLPGVLASMAGLLLGGLLFLPFYIARGMWAGDVKLMGAVGSFLGPYQVLAATIVVALLGGLLAAWFAFRQKRLRAALRESLMVVFRQQSPKTLAHAAKEDVIPYGLAIASGTLLYLLLTVSA